MIRIYRIIVFLISPFLRLYLEKRKISGKEDRERFGERLGFSSVQRPEGDIFWFHAASVGESMSVLTLVDKVLEQYEDITILVTTGTITSANIMKKRLKNRCLHQYVPVDTTEAVKRFISFWKPKASFWVESELWPNLAFESHNHGCRMFLVNGRISRESYRKWKWLKFFARRLLSCFDLILAQSEDDKQRFLNLGGRDVRYIGNLKYDSADLPSNPKEMAELTCTIGEREVLLAASTHEGEEKIIMQVHKKLKEKYNLITIIVPRHPERGRQVMNLARKEKLSAELRSGNGVISQSTDIYVADTIGELGTFYRLAYVVFMGGSLVKHGGQNPLEPARLESAIISGKYNFNFEKIYADLEAKKAAIIIEDEEKLHLVAGRIMGNPSLRMELAANAREFVKSSSGAAERFLAEINKVMEG